MVDRTRRVINFIKADIWRIRARDLPRRKFWLLRLLRVVILAFRGFSTDKCSLRAAALTFHTILAIVPAAAIGFGIAKAFKFEAMLEERLNSALQGQEEIAQQIIDFSRDLLENTNEGVIAGVGVALVFWTVIKVLSQIERSFNDVWGIREARTIGRKFTDYVSMMLICPLLIVISGSATVFVAGRITEAVEGVSFLRFFGPVVLTLLKLLPYCIGWALFTFVYVFMPNTKVNLRSAIVAGVVAGTLYQLVQWGYVSLQIGVSKYGAIYGSFAALPLFLIWLQLSWLVVLFGAELSFAHQNVETYEFEPDCLRASHNLKTLLALVVTRMLAVNFADGKPPATVAEISHRLGAPIRLTNDVLYELVDAGVLSETKGEAYKEVGYQPARDIGKLTVAYVVEALGRRGSEDIPLVRSEEMQRLSKSLAELGMVVRNAPANVLLKDV
jgi:membrane protein